jgi:hypothetical protein
MHVLHGGLLAMVLAPSGDPRAIDPAANRPEILAPGGSAASVAPVKMRPPKGSPSTGPKAPPKVELRPKPQPKPEPRTKPAPRSRRRPPPTVTDDDGEALPRCMHAHGLCWRLTMAGIVAASVGVTAIGSGIGLMFAPQYAVADEPTMNRSLRPPGLALVSVGAVSMALGVVSIVVGHAVHGRPKRATNMATVQLGPGGLRW